MRWLNIFRRFTKQKPQNKSVNLKNDNLDYDPEGHHKILDYIKDLWEGGDVDAEFEKISLRNDLHLNSLNLASLFFHISNERNVPIKQTVHFLRVGTEGGVDPEIASLIERIDILAKEFSEPEYLNLLSSGLVGDKKEIIEIREAFDSVGLIIKFCNAIASLSDLKNN